GEEELDLEELCDRAGITAERARQLEEFGLLEPRIEAGERVYAESEADIAAACEALAQFGIDARNLRAFRTAADRESGLVEAGIAPAPRSRNRGGGARGSPGPRARERRSGASRLWPTSSASPRAPRSSPTCSFAATSAASSSS